MKPKDQYVRMRNFMLDNNVGINSTLDLFNWAKKIVKEKNGACLCNPKDRLECPCSQALNEIKKIGHCACRLFGNNNACQDCDRNCKLEFTYLTK